MLRHTFQSSPWKSLSDSAARDKLLLQTYAEFGGLWATRLKISERSSVSSGVVNVIGRIQCGDTDHANRDLQCEDSW